MADVQPQPANKMGGRRRNRRKDDDDDDENENNNNEQQQQVVSQTIDGAAAAPSSPPPPPVAAPVAPPVAPPARPMAPKARAAAAAPAALHALHTDPNTLEAMAQRGAEDGKAAAAAMTADGVFALDFDTLTYDALCEVMRQVPVQRIVEKMAAREREAQAALQQQSQRIERFLDVAPLLATSSSTGTGSSNGDAATATTTPTAAAASSSSSSGYTYTMMLTRLFEALNLNNEGGAMKERNQLPVPVIDKIGKKKTVISNFARICAIFHRPVEDVKDFIEKELSTRGNLDSNNALILKFEIRRATDFDNILIKYLDEFVKCNSCHRIDTTLTKDGRRTELRCNWCTATRTVQAVGSATFSAQIEKRSRQRAAMTL